MDADVSAAEKIRPFGHLAHVMKDQLYWLPRGHVYTTPCVSVSISQRFYVMIVVSIEGTPFRLQCEDFDEEVQAAVIAPGSPRHVHAPGIKLISFHVNPHHKDFSSFRGLAGTGPLPLDRRLFDHLTAKMEETYHGRLSTDAVTSMQDEVTALICGLMPDATPMDSRVARALEIVDEQAGQVSLDKLSQQAGVSYHWLSRKFSDLVGLPLRTYCLWRKVQGASQVLLQTPALVALVHKTGYLGGDGMGVAAVSLTSLAHEAGFSDSAHLAHTMQELCGGPLSHFLFSGDVRLHLPPLAEAFTQAPEFRERRAQLGEAIR